VELVSEDSAQISPFLRDVEKRFGTPVAVVHDMGKGILKAVATVFRGVPDFVCHFHFLRDAGKDLLDRDYDRIRKALRRHRVGAKLARLMRSLKPTLSPDQLRRFAARIKRTDASARRRAAPQLPAMAAYSLAAWALDGKHQGGG